MCARRGIAVSHLLLTVTHLRLAVTHVRVTVTHLLLTVTHVRLSLLSAAGWMRRTGGTPRQQRTATQVQPLPI